MTGASMPWRPASVYHEHDERRDCDRIAVRNEGMTGLVVDSCGHLSLDTDESETVLSPALLRYAADLSEYRAAVHAASDRQRKLDAVKAAEAAMRKAEDEYAALAEALVAARREAGL